MQNEMTITILLHPIIAYTHTEITTVLPQIMAPAFISFQQLSNLATKQDQRLYETGIYQLKF